MSKSSSKSGERKTKPEIELHEDAWPRFEQFIKDVAKAGPKHRGTPKPKRPTRPRRNAK